MNAINSQLNIKTGILCYDSVFMYMRIEAYIATLNTGYRTLETLQGKI